MATTRPRRPAASEPAHRPPPPRADAGSDEGTPGREGKSLPASQPDARNGHGGASPGPAGGGLAEGILHHALEEAARLLRSDGAMAYLLDEATGILRYADDAGITDDRRRRWVRSLKVDIGVGMFGQAVADGRVIVTDDYSADPSFVHFPGADRLVKSLAIRSFLVAPLVSGERTFGAMGTYSSRPAAFGDAEVALVRALADHAAAAMANADLIAQLDRSRAEVERRAGAERALREIGGRIIGLRRPDEVLQQAVDEAARLLGADGARIDLLNEADGALYWAYDATTGKRPGLGPIQGSGEARAGEGISGRAVRELRAIFTGDYLADDRFEHASAPDEHVRRHAIRSVVAVPLIGDRGPLGTLTVYSSAVDAFAEDDARLIEALAGQAAIAMTNARLIEELDRSRAEFRRSAEAERSLREIAARITAIRDPSDLLQDVVDEAARLLEADRVRIDLIGPVGGRVGYTHIRGAGEHIGGAAVDDGGSPFTYGASGRAIATGRTVVSGDYLADTGFDHDPQLDRAVREDGVRSLIVTPMSGESGLLGVLQVGRPEVDAFGPTEVALAEALAHQAAIAIQNTRLIAALEQSREEIRRRALAEQALREVAARITAIRDPAELLQEVTHTARRLLGGVRAQLDVIDPATGLIRWAHVSGEGRFGQALPGTTEGVPAELGVNAPAIRERRVIVSADYLKDERLEHVRASDAFVRKVGIHAVIAAPLFSDDGILGVIKVASTERGAFDDEDAALMEAFADQAVVAIQNARLIEELGRSREEISRRADAERTVREIAASITALRDADAILQQTVNEARRLLDAGSARIDMVEGARLVWAFASGEVATRTRERGLDTSFAIGEGVAGKAVATGETVVTGEYLADDRFVHLEDSDALVREIEANSVVSAPLRGEGDPLGALSVSSRRKDAYGPADSALIQALADQAAIAIQNARLIAELNRSREEISRRADAERTVREIAANISAIRDPNAVLQQTVDAARRLLHSESARIDLLDGEELVWTYASGDEEIARHPDASLARTKIGRGVGGAAVARRQAIITDDYLADRGFPHIPATDAFIARTGIRSVLAVPLLGETGPLGALVVSSRRGAEYDDADATLLQALADQAAIAIQNARLIEELNRSRGELGRRAEEEQALREIATRITATKGAQDVLQRTVDEAARLLGADEARIDLIDETSGLLRWAYHSATSTPNEKWDWPDAPDESIDQGVSGRAVIERRVAFTGDYLNDPSFIHSSGPDGFVREAGIKSVMSAPLMNERGPFGALTIYTTREHAWDHRDARLIEAIATQAAIVVQNARLIEELDRSSTELARRAEAQQSLREIAARITAIREPGPLLQQVVDAARRLVGADGSILDLVDPSGNVLRWAYDSGVRAGFTDAEIAELTIPIGQGATGVAVTEDRVVTASDDLASQFPPSAVNDRFFEVTGFRSMIVAPITGENGPLGALEVYSCEPGAFDDEDAAVIRSLASQAAIAITNARLIGALEQSQAALAARAETERSLRDISARITSLRDPSEILARVVEESRRLLRSDGAHLTRMSEDGTYLVPVIVAGGMDAGTEAWLKEMRFPLGGGINGLAAEEVLPVWTADYAADPRIPHDADDNAAAQRLGLAAMAAAPLRAPAGEVIGTLAISYARPREVVPDELDLLQGLADQAAIALTNSTLYELLGESEARYRHLVQDSPDLIWSIDADARFTFVSDTAERLTGWAPDELLGRHFGALVHESSSDVAQIDWTAGMTGAYEEVRGRLNLLHRDGHPVPAEFIAFGTRDETGAFAGANGSVRDMTERDRLESALRQSEERYRFLVENSPDIIYAIDLEGRFTFVSETVRLTLGYDPEELVGEPFARLIQYEDDAQRGARFELMRQNPDLELTSRLTLVHADGRPIPFEVSSVGLIRDGAFAGIHGSARDISERERLERELRSSEERYRYLVKASPDVIWAVDEEGLITFMSDRIVDLTGYPLDQVVGQHFSFLTEPASMAPSLEVWEAVRGDPLGVHQLRILMPSATGEKIPVEIWLTGRIDEGRFVGAHGSIRDIRERERLEQDLRNQAGELASSQERAHLARELHDSVTQALFSMTLVTRTAELLIDRDAEAAKEKLGALRDLQREALAEMRALIFELRPGNLENDGLLPALRTHAAALQGRIGLPIVVTSELTDRLPLSIEEVVYRIAQEALHNVVKHAAARQVRVTVDRRRTGVVLRIEDDGRGFETGSVPDGHLGLAGMRARAAKVGASFEVISKPGGGTTIEVVVPDASIEDARERDALRGRTAVRPSAE